MRRDESIEELDEIAGVDIDGELLVVPAHHPRDTELTGIDDADLTRGDLDADWELEEIFGDDPDRRDDRNIVDELGEAIGLTYEEDEELACGAKEWERDRHRWELDPASAEDWRDRRKR